ncbi:MAG TPA: LytTR family DNA-binding domain-containing protein [Steroidobacteraceae bacterium]|nr:LytTR family DNA-binding domain-containing protein [Steroidobacteraceae bacterium]
MQSTQATAIDMDTVPLLEPATARRVFSGQMAFLAVLLSAIAISNVFTEIADRARDGVHLAAWQPLTSEFSSVVCLWLLVPAIGWWLSQFPLVHGGWARSLPAHLLATLPFSLAHVGGMSGLRYLVYELMGSHYDVAPWWPIWLYEYRKDFITYWLLLVCIVAFRLYGLWVDSRHSSAMKEQQVRIAGGAATISEAAGDTPLERLVVRKLNREYVIAVGDVDRVEADGNYVNVYAQGNTYPRRESLAALEKKLDARRFVRVHRGQLVNVDRIREIQPWDHGDYRIVLQDGTCVNLSRRYRARLQHLLR